MRESLIKAFAGDTDIYRFYDPNKNPLCIEDIVNDVQEKIEGYLAETECEFVDLENGYIFYQQEPKLLVSFGLNKEYRTPEGQAIFWNEIVNHLGNHFSCFLWTQNQRAIKWLVKMGMKIEREYPYENNYITVLNYS